MKLIIVKYLHCRDTCIVEKVIAFAEKTTPTPTGLIGCVILLRCLKIQQNENVEKQQQHYVSEVGKPICGC